MGTRLCAARSQGSFIGGRLSRRTTCPRGPDFRRANLWRQVFLAFFYGHDSKSDRKIHIRGAGDPTQLGGGGKIEAGSGGSPVPKFAGVADRSVAAGFLIGAGGDIFTGETFALATVSRGGGSAGENVL
jgi:hypothetical protein